jgi:hypothetical protein
MRGGSRESQNLRRARRRYGKFDRMNAEASCDLHYYTSMKRLRAHSRHFTRES